MKTITITVPDDQPVNEMRLLDAIEEGASTHTIQFTGDGDRFSIRHARLGATITVER